MKVYLFDSKSGIYEGEDFCDSSEIDENDGITALAPPDAEPGHVIVYDPVVRGWAQVSVEAMEGGSHD